jgi:hypothetical protein
MDGVVTPRASTADGARVHVRRERELGATPLSSLSSSPSPLVQPAGASHVGSQPSVQRAGTRQFSSAERGVAVSAERETPRATDESLDSRGVPERTASIAPDASSGYDVAPH